MVLAHIGWDLAQFSGGRFMLGLGTQVKGHNERRFSVPWVPPGPRLRDMVRAIRAIWDSWQHGTRLDFRSRHYTHTLMTPFFNPSTPAMLGRKLRERFDGLVDRLFLNLTYEPAAKKIDWPRLIQELAA
jgi:alkanesulfonate monooxygenase SsuD/methylene tetrahydromethanopterin reductase-like flavin-dependent oxidoreductase (luciferase family)